MSQINYLQGYAFAKKKGDTIHVFEGPHTLAVTNTEQKKILSAGDRYGIRYEEFLTLECARLRRELQRIQAAAGSFRLEASRLSRTTHSRSAPARIEFRKSSRQRAQSTPPTPVVNHLSPRPPTHCSMRSAMFLSTHSGSRTRWRRKVRTLRACTSV